MAIGEPISRPQYIHEYQLTKYSLYAAASMELTDVDIERVLLNLCKNAEIPIQVIEFIREHCKSYGKAKLVLKNNMYFVEASDVATINRLMNVDVVKTSVQAQIQEDREAQEALLTTADTLTMADRYTSEGRVASILR